MVKITKSAKRNGKQTGKWITAMSVDVEKQKNSRDAVAAVFIKTCNACKGW